MKKNNFPSVVAVFFWCAGVFFQPILPASGNGVVVTEPEGIKTTTPQKTRAKPVKKPAVPNPSPPAQSSPGRKEQSPVPEVNTFLREGLWFLEQRYFSKATSLLEQAAREDPGNPEAWFALGRVYQERGLFSKAQDAYRKTLEVSPGYPPLSRILAYPSDGRRIPLWDPVRPGRIETIPATTGGFVILSPKETSPVSSAAPVYSAPLPRVNNNGQPAIGKNPSTGNGGKGILPPVKPSPEKNSSKLHPFVPVRIIVAPENDESTQYQQQKAGPVYLPPEPVYPDVNSGSEPDNTSGAGGS